MVLRVCILFVLCILLSVKGPVHIGSAQQQTNQEEIQFVYESGSRQVEMKWLNLVKLY